MQILYFSFSFSFGYRVPYIYIFKYQEGVDAVALPVFGGGIILNLNDELTDFLITLQAIKTEFAGELELKATKQFEIDALRQTEFLAQKQVELAQKQLEIARKQVELAQKEVGLAEKLEEVILNEEMLEEVNHNVRKLEEAVHVATFASVLNIMHPHADEDRNSKFN